MAVLGLSEGFVLMEEGVQDLRIVSAEGKPKANPQQLVVKMENAKGAELSNKYILDPKNQKAWFVTSMFLKGAFGAKLKEFDTENISQLVGKYIKCEIVHNKVQRKDSDGNLTDQYMTFANIKNILGTGDPFTTEGSQEQTSRPVL